MPWKTSSIAVLALAGACASPSDPVEMAMALMGPLPTAESIADPSKSEK